MIISISDDPDKVVTIEATERQLISMAIILKDMAAGDCYRFSPNENGYVLELKKQKEEASCQHK